MKHRRGILEDVLKRFFDVICATAGLLLLSPILGLTAAAVWLGSGRPVLYRGVRAGRWGIPFRVFKFRTMVAGAETLGGMSTGRTDKRVTRVGVFLRRHKLDELPQLVNVWKGEMSMVGPRPEMPEYTRLYQGEEDLILSVKPGITDYASLRFSRLDEVLGEDAPDSVYENQVRPIKNALRVDYVKTRSFRRDLELVARTVLVVMGWRKWNTFA